MCQDKYSPVSKPYTRRGQPFLPYIRTVKSSAVCTINLQSVKICVGKILRVDILTQISRISQIFYSDIIILGHRYTVHLCTINQWDPWNLCEKISVRNHTQLSTDLHKVQDETVGMGVIPVLSPPQMKSKVIDVLKSNGWRNRAGIKIYWVISSVCHCIPTNMFVSVSAIAYCSQNKKCVSLHLKYKDERYVWNS